MLDKVELIFKSYLRAPSTTFYVGLIPIEENKILSCFSIESPLHMFIHIRGRYQATASVDQEFSHHSTGC